LAVLNIKRKILKLGLRAETAFALCVLMALSGCGEVRHFEDFSHRDPYMKESDFKRDSDRCEIDKVKHSSKIEGRNAGFKGEDTGYLGCMISKGWQKNIR
jgi:hypothetical protein